MTLEQRRRTDRGPLCWIAMRTSQIWDWIDERDIDKHAVSVVILYGTWVVTRWAMGFAAVASSAGRPGLDSAAVIAAVTAPYMALQAAAIGFYFKARAQ